MDTIECVGTQATTMQSWKVQSKVAHEKYQTREISATSSPNNYFNGTSKCSIFKIHPWKINMEPENTGPPGRGKSSEPNHHQRIRIKVAAQRFKSTESNGSKTPHGVHTRWAPDPVIIGVKFNP